MVFSNPLILAATSNRWRSKTHHSRDRGQGVTEYTIIGVLIVGVAIGGLLVLGKNLNTSYMGMVPKAPDKIAISGPPPTANTGAAASASTSTSAPITKPPGSPVASPPTAGLVLDKALAEPLSATIMTVGVNGASKTLADSLVTVASQALQKGSITPDQYSSLMQLSNQGHKLADIESVLETAAQNYRPGTDFFNQKVTYNGQQVTVNSLYQTIGYDRINIHDLNSVSNPFNMPDGAYRETQAFINIYKDLQKSGALADPAVNSTVSAISTNILYLNDSLDIAMLSIDRNIATPADMQTTAASAITHSGAVTICTTGNGTDSGTHCSGGNSGSGNKNQQ